jgi:parallel beta-helix repeat protein
MVFLEYKKFLIPNQENYVITTNSNIENSETHTTISIGGNGGLIGFPDKSGSGNSTHPYVIEDMIINATNATARIELVDIELYRVIQNCTLVGTNSSLQAGIKLINCTNVNITGCNITRCYYGIFAIQCNGDNIFGNIVNYSAIGIQMETSNNFTITNNSIEKNANGGIIIAAPEKPSGVAFSSWQP